MAASETRDWPDVQALPGLLAVPAGVGPWPGVVVVPDIFGVSNDLGDQLAWLASEGFLAFGVDLFHSGTHLACLVRTFRELNRRSGGSFDRIRQARAAVAARPDCTGNVGVLGFCLGGDFALLMAREQIFRVSAVNYGSVPDDAATVLEGACPIVGSFGGRDRRLRGAAEALDAALDDLAIDRDIKEYPNAGHAFMNTAGLLVSFLARMGTSGYQEDAATDARRRIVSFFRTRLD